MKNIIICDIDGTLCTDEHRNHILHEGERDAAAWEKYFSLCHLDPPVEAVIKVLQAFGVFSYENMVLSYEIHLMTARNKSTEDQTLDWLRRHKVPFNSVTFRPEDSRVQDNVLKTAWADKLGGPERVLFVLEDRQRVVDAWRAAGYTCFQVAPGNF